MSGIANDNISLKDRLEAARAKDRARRKIIYTSIFVAAFALSSAPASAQQPLSPSAVAIQIDNVINQWAQQLEADQRAIAALQKENADLKAAAANPMDPAAKDKK